MKNKTTMDLTEAFRGEDISKTDFFDFVVAPDMNENQSSLNFNKTLKSMGIFIDNGDVSNSQSNSNHINYQEVKETNNNNLLLPSPASTTESTILGGVVSTIMDGSFWSSNCDKETVRLETAILEDLNKFCWNQEQVSSNESEVSHASMSMNSNTSNNTDDTDGAIYTLTVLNGENNPTWYRVQQESTSIIKEEDSQHHSLSSPNNTDCQSLTHIKHEQNPSSLDLDSILNIIPNHAHSINEHPIYHNGYHNPSLDSANVMVKAETQYSYDNKDCENDMRHVMNATSVETQESCNYNNNNNEWDLPNDNSHEESTKSLLRSALQGKSFLARYASSPKSGAGDMVKMTDDHHRELRQVLSTPPSCKTPMNHSPAFMTSVEPDDCERKHSPMMTPVMEIGTSITFDDSSGRVFGMIDSDNPSSTHSMEDILLSHLNVTNYSEDYEKLRRIANEVAESANQYCGIGSGGYVSPHLTPPDGTLNHSILSPIHHHPHHHHQLSPLMTTVTLPSTNKSGKKYGKAKSHASRSSQGSLIQANGVRKERSLHYCSICSKGFKDKYSVNVHIRTHTGEKPFACTLCGKSFRQKAHLAKHYQTHIAQKSAAASGHSTNKQTSTKNRFNNSTKPS